MNNHGQKETIMLNIKVSKESNMFQHTEAIRNSIEPEVSIEFDNRTVVVPRETAIVIFENMAFMLTRAFFSGFNGDTTSPYMKKNA